MPHFSATVRTASGKVALVHLHHEFENVAAHAAAEAVIDLLHRMHGERRRLFRMERAQAGEILRRFFSGARIRRSRGRCPPAASRDPRMTGFSHGGEIHDCPERFHATPFASCCSSQLDDRDGFAAALVGFRRGCFRPADARKKFREAAAQRARAVAVNDAHCGLAGERGLVDEFVDAARGFFDCAADHVDFVGGGFVARLRVHGDAARAGLRAARPASASALRPSHFDADDLRERHLHAQRPRFDFGAAAVAAPQDHRLRKPAHRTRWPADKLLRRNGLARRVGRDAEVGLRCGESATTAASASARASPAIFAMRRPDCFSICARSARSYIGREARDFSFEFFCVSAKFFSSSAMRFRWRSTHSV